MWNASCSVYVLALICVAGTLIPLLHSTLFSLEYLRHLCVISVVGWFLWEGLICAVRLFLRHSQHVVYELRFKKIKQYIVLIRYLVLTGFAFLCIVYMVSARLSEGVRHIFPEEWSDIPVVLDGWVDGLPRETSSGRRFSIQVTGMVLSGHYVDDEKMPRKVWLGHYDNAFNQESSSTKVDQNIIAGQCIRLVVKLKSPHGLMNPHGFDLEQWLFSHGFDATGAVVRHQKVTVLADCTDAWSDKVLQSLQRVRHIIREKIYHVLGRNSPYVGVIVALVIGDQAAIPDIQWQMFNATGIGHLISISGFHITFLANVFVVAVRNIVRRVPLLLRYATDRVWSGAVGICAAVVYVFLAGGGIPAQRTACMMILLSVAWSMGSAIRGIVLVAWSLIIMLCMDSLAPLSAGFWLSFVGVTALIVSGIGWVGVPSFLRQAIHSQWVATLSLMPISWYIFGQVSLVAPFANALAIPIISMLVTPLALLGSLFPHTDWALQWAYQLFSALETFLSYLAAGHLISAVWREAQPTLWATLLASVGLIYACSSLSFFRKEVAVLSLLPLWMPASFPPLHGTVRATVFDVGQGLSVLLETASHRLLYDAGPRPVGVPNTVAVDAGSRVLIPFFRGEGINHLDMLVISHNDLDHRGGVEAIFQNMAISQFVNSDNDASRFPQKSIKTDFFTCVTGQSWHWDGVLFEVLSPSQDRLANESHSNDRSCVIRAQAGNRSILLTGDAELSVEQELLAQMPEKLPSTILIAGHHGSRSSTSLAWLERVIPEWTVFSAGYRNRYGHPHPEVLKNLQHIARPFVRTDQLGAITFELSDSAKPIPLSYREDVRRVWHRWSSKLLLNCR